MKEHMKKNRKTFAVLALTFLVALGACGSSGSEAVSKASDINASGSEAVLKASDINASVSCGQWRPIPSEMKGQADCDISIKNNSSASGVIFIQWEWMDGSKQCGYDFTLNADDQIGFVQVDANESVTINSVGTMLCHPDYANPVAENISVMVQD
jgi:hypothetical protein